MLIGRLTRDPEVKAFSNGGKVAKFGFAVSNRKKNSQTGQWEDDPVFLNVEAFNRGEYGKQADLCEQLRKGSQVFIEGRLQLDQWTSQDGQKRSQVKVVVDNFQFLDPRGERATVQPDRTTAPSEDGAYNPPPAMQSEEDGSIPF
jgi:single-strand DNA-binding protein